MTRSVRRRFWLESVLAGATLVMLIVTLITREWIEETLGVDPDSGSGVLEWVIVAALAAATVVSARAARREWQRPAVAG